MSGAGNGNRTRMASLEGWSSTIELYPQLESLGGHCGECRALGQV